MEATGSGKTNRKGTTARAKQPTKIIIPKRDEIVNAQSGTMIHRGDHRLSTHRYRPAITLRGSPTCQTWRGSALVKPATDSDAGRAWQG